jgi:hypothetical protein
MSIGSLGEDQSEYANVSNIHFEDVTVIDAVYASRFKSWMGGQGIANITWKNIRVYNVTFPIFVTQSYSNQGSSDTAWYWSDRSGEQCLCHDGRLCLVGLHGIC